jgi:hypothetical protein
MRRMQIQMSLGTGPNRNAQQSGHLSMSFTPWTNLTEQRIVSSLEGDHDDGHCAEPDDGVRRT